MSGKGEAGAQTRLEQWQSCLTLHMAIKSNIIATDRTRLFLPVWFESEQSGCVWSRSPCFVWLNNNWLAIDSQMLKQIKLKLLYDSLYKPFPLAVQYMCLYTCTQQTDFTFTHTAVAQVHYKNKFISVWNHPAIHTIASPFHSLHIQIKS